jgi:hypothetical protein
MMEEFLSGGGGGGMGGGGASDPVTAIANLGTELYRFYQSLVDAVTFKEKRRWELIPDYTDPADYRPEPDYTIPIVIGGMVFVFAIMALALRR